MDKSVSEIIERGLRGYVINDLVDGWVFRIDEVSSNLYKIDGDNNKGQKVSNFGIDPEKVLKKCIDDAQRINSRKALLNKLINKFLRLFQIR